MRGKRTQDAHEANASKDEAETQKHEDTQDAEADGNVDTRHGAQLAGLLPGIDGIGIALGLIW